MRLGCSRLRGRAQPAPTPAMSARFVRPQPPVFCFKPGIGNVVSAEPAMGTGRNQGAPRDARDLVAALAAIVRGFARYFPNLLAHGRMSAAGMRDSNAGDRPAF